MKSIRRIVRKMAETFAPKLLFEFRSRKYGNEEPELALVPLLCDTHLATVDVGAHWGLYSSIMARHSRLCYAFEANPAVARTLEKTALPGVEVIHAALSEKSGELTLRVPRNCLQQATVERQNTLSDIGPQTGIDEVIVPTKRLDDCSLEPVSLIKIDVEGHEEAVLHGAETLIARDHPFFIIECEERHKPGSVERVRQWMASRGYRGWFFRDGKLTSLENFRTDLHQTRHQLLCQDGSYINNFIFAHETKLDRISHLS